MKCVSVIQKMLIPKIIFLKRIETYRLFALKKYFLPNLETKSNMVPLVFNIEAEKYKDKCAQKPYGVRFDREGGHYKHCLCSKFSK